MDTAFKTGQSSDYSAIGCFIETTKGKIYLTNVVKEKLEFPDLKRRLLSIVEGFPADIIWIEDKASGQSLIQELKRDTGLPIIPIKVDRDKISRASSAAPMVESRNVFLPQRVDALRHAVFLDHGGGVWTVFGHLRDVVVKRGQRVVRGERIATVGTTGWTRVPALYFEVRWPVAGESVPVDPALFNLALPLGELDARVADPRGELSGDLAKLEHLRLAR